MGGSSSSRPVKLPSSSPSAGADDLVEQGAERLDHEVEGAGDEDGAVPEGLVGPDPGDAGRERLGQQQVVEEVPAVVAQAGHRGALVAAVEGAQEVAPVAAVEGQQRRGLGQQVGHEGGPLAGGQVPGGQPGVGVDDVGGDQGVLEVEGGQVPVGGEDVLPGPVGPVGLDRLARAWSAPGRAR